jgi:hypothetical protein
MFWCGNVISSFTEEIYLLHFSIIMSVHLGLYQVLAKLPGKKALIKEVFMVSAGWICNNGKKLGVLIQGVANELTIARNPPGPGGFLAPYRDSLRRGFLDRDARNNRAKSFTYIAPEGSATCDKNSLCHITAGNSVNVSLSLVRQRTQFTIWGEYQIVVALKDVINEYTHDEASILDGRWQHVNTLPPLDGVTQTIGAWLFQSGPNTLSVIAREKPSQDGSNFLVGYEIRLGGAQGEDGVEVIEREKNAESESDGSEHGKDLIGPVPLVAATDVIVPVPLVVATDPIDRITSSAAFLLTSFDEENLFHLLVARGAVIEHFTHSSESILDGPWTRATLLPPPSDVPEIQVTAVAFVQSSQGKFEVVARVTPLTEGDSFLVGYELDLINNQDGWSPPFPLPVSTSGVDEARAALPASINGVTGSPIIIESSFDDQDRFDLLVPRLGPSGFVIDHYIHEFGSIRKGQWTHFATLDPFQGFQFTAVSLVQNQAGGFEAIARARRPEGDEVVVGYELQPGTKQWSDGVALNADDDPILAGKPT